MNSPSTQKRWIALWLPRMTTDLFLRGAPGPDNGLAAYEKQGGAYVIAGVDQNAARAGIAPGMTLADARARQPLLHVVEADREGEAALLDRLAGFCERWTPAIAPDPPDGLALEISETAHLFGGEEALSQEIARRIKAGGVSVRVSIADTPRAAWALARYARTPCAAPGANAEALGSLPVASLRLEREAEDLLMRLGLKTIGALIARPRAPFAARAGEAAMRALDEALGKAQPALRFRHPPAPIFALRRFLEPLADAEALMIGVRDGADEVARALELKGLGARRLALSLFGVSGRVRRIALGFSEAEREGQALARPFRERLAGEAENADLEFGVEALRLDVVETGRFEPGAGSAAARLVDRLSARLGASAVRRIACADAHWPEHAALSVPALAGAPPVLAPALRARPLTLLARPEPIEALATLPDGPPWRFRWRKVLRKVARAEGPERIAPPWHERTATPARDYFHIEDESGARFWVYREIVDDAAGPRWFMHGLFP